MDPCKASSAASPVLVGSRSRHRRGQSAFAIIGAVSRRMLKDGQPPERIALFRQFYVGYGYEGLLHAAAHFAHVRFLRNGELLSDDDMP